MAMTPVAMTEVVGSGIETNGKYVSHGREQNHIDANSVIVGLDGGGE